MITITLTDREAIKLRKQLGAYTIPTDPDLARVFYKVEHALKRPAVKPRSNREKSSRVIFISEDD